MNKQIYWLIALALIVGVAIGYYYAPVLFGQVSKDYNYYTATNAAVTCSGGTSTVVLAMGSGRLSFIASNAGGQAITLCRKTNGCVGTQGIYMTTSTLVYTQIDGYVGPYSCIGTGGSSTLGISYSN